MRPFLSLLLGVVACSTAVIWIKSSGVEPVLLCGLRLTIAAAVLAPIAARDWRRHRASLRWSHLRDAAIPGMILAAHFISWMIGARMTLASNGTLVVTMTPLVTPVLLWLLAGDRVTPRERRATVVALAGLSILFAAGYRYDRETLAGDAVCFCSMLIFAVYLVLGRRFRHHPTNTLYVTPVFAVAAAVSLAAAPLAADGRQTDWAAEAPVLLGLAVVPTIVGHSLLVGAMRRIGGQTVAVVNMAQCVIAAILGWALLGEAPGAAFYPAAALILAAGGMLLVPERAATGD